MLMHETYVYLTSTSDNGSIFILDLGSNLSLRRHSIGVHASGPYTSHNLPPLPPEVDTCTYVTTRTYCNTVDLDSSYYSIMYL